MNRHIKNKDKFEKKMKNNNINNEFKKVKKRRKIFDNKNNKHFNKINKLNELLEIPVEIRGNKSKVTLLDFNKMFIENYLNIEKYDENLIEIATASGNVIINGFNLKLSEMNDEDIMIVGKIDIIEFKK